MSTIPALSRSTPPTDPVKSSILASSTSGWSPLRLNKRDDTPSRIPASSGLSASSSGKRARPSSTPVRRTSSSFSHVRNHSLVSNSPFVRAAISSTPPPGLGSRPSKIPTPNGRAEPRRVSLEKKRLIGENTQPEGPVQGFKRRQSKGFQGLTKAEYVSKSPFRALSSSTSSGSGTEDPSTPVHEAQQEPEQESPSPMPSSSSSSMPPPPPPPPMPSFPSSSSMSSEMSMPPRISIAPRLPTSSSRSNLVSKRMHGPRIPSRSASTSKRVRRKTVTFDERCDVVEFDAESFEQDEEVFYSDEDIEYDPNRRSMSPGDDEEGYDSQGSEVEEAFASETEEEDESEFLETILAAEAATPESTMAPSTSTNSPMPSTPPQSSPRPLLEDAEDGVPYGRSHHAERLKARLNNTPPPSTPLRNESDLNDGPPSPSPARSRPLPSFLATSSSSLSTEAPPSPTLAPRSASPPPPARLDPLRLSPPPPPPSKRLSNESFQLPSMAESSPFLLATSEFSSNDAEVGIAPPQPRGLANTASLSSLESSGSINGRSTPRISRDNVKKRLLKTRSLSATPPLQQEERDVFDTNDATFGQVERAASPARLNRDRALPPLPLGAAVDRTPSPATTLPASEPAARSQMHARHSSIDLNKPGVDLGEVRSALDRLMLGVERGFVDESTSHEASFMDDASGPQFSFVDAAANSSFVSTSSADVSMDTADERDTQRFSTMTDMSVGEVLGAARATFVSAETKRAFISPPSPLLSVVPMESSTTVRGPPTPVERTPSMMTETETEEEGPQTPSIQSLAMPSPHTFTTDPFMLNTGELQEHEERSRFAAPKEEKALPRTPQPRLSLDLSSLSSFGHHLNPPSETPAVPAIQVIRSPTLSGKEALRAHEAHVLALRREARRRERGDDSVSRESSLRDERPQRKRSQSTSDALDVRTERAAADRTRAERDLNSSLGPATSLEELPLSESIEEELNKMHASKEQRKYHLRERSETIYASSSEQKISHIGSVGDIDSGKAWRAVRRPSDMNEYSREIREFRAQEKPGKGHGKVFVKVLGIKAINVPIPRLPTFFTCTLNNGIHFVTTPDCRLAKDAPIDQEFELIEHGKLEFTLTLKIRKDPHIQAQSRPPPPPAPVPVAPSPPPQKSGGMRAFFGGSPKKPKPVARLPVVPPPPAVVEDTLSRYLRPDGTLARAFISFKDIAKRCDARLFETSFPLVGQSDGPKSVGSTSARVVGEMILQVFRLPPLPGLTPDQLPQSLDECLRGLRHIAWHKVTYHEGTLTQSGGDCSSWRRRQFRVIGSRLVAFNDITKKATATIELKQAIAVIDDDEPTPNYTESVRRRRSRESYDAVFKVERSFRLVFPDEGEIEFFADTDQEKADWLQVLRALIGRIPPNPLWAELVWQRQQELAMSHEQR